MAKKVTPQPVKTPSTLLKSLTDVRAALDARIKFGKDLEARQISSRPDFDSAHADFLKWHEFNSSLLKRLFAGDEFQSDYDQMYRYSLFARDMSLREEVEDFREDI